MKFVEQKKKKKFQHSLDKVKTKWQTSKKRRTFISILSQLCHNLF